MWKSLDKYQIKIFFNELNFKIIIYNLNKSLFQFNFKFWYTIWIKIMCPNLNIFFYSFLLMFKSIIVNLFISIKRRCCCCCCCSTKIKLFFIHEQPYLTQNRAFFFISTQGIELNFEQLFLPPRHNAKIKNKQYMILLMF